MQSPVATRIGTANGISGTVHGGQQPVAGATIQLYAVGTSEDGSAATPLLSVPVLTNASGSFTITGDYSCQNATLVYLTATGGNPGLAAVNPNLAEMTALGPCSSLSASTFISVNELSTVAAASSLAPYMTSLAAIGSSAQDALTLASAFALSSELVDPSSGVTPGYNVPAGLSVPVAELNTLADIVAACINSSGGVAGSAGSCGTLFSLTTPANGLAPTNIIAALLNLANNPTLNTAALLNLAAANAPFQPQLTSVPADFAVKLLPNAGTAALTLSPSGLVFPKTAIGFASQPLSVTIANSRTAAIVLNSVTLTGVNAAAFTQTNTCGTSLAAGTSCAVQIMFTPAASGVQNAVLVVSSGGAGSPQTVALTGSGGAPGAGPITVSTPVPFIYAGTLQDIVVSNLGLGPLTIRGITSSDPSFVIETNGCGTLLPAQSVCTVTVQSNGLQINTSTLSYNTYTGTLTIDDDSSAGPQKIALSSTNSAYVKGAYPASTSIFTPSVLNFGAWAVSSSVPGGVVTVRNGSYYTSSSITVSIAGPNASDFTAPSYTCSVPPPCPTTAACQSHLPPLRREPATPA